MLRDGRFMAVVGLSFLVALVFQQGSVGLPVAMGEAGFTPADYGMAIAVNGVLIVALQIPVTRFIEHRDPRRLLVVSSLLAGYGFGLTAFAGSVGVFALAVVRLDPRRDRQRAHADGPGRPALAGPRPRPLPGHVHPVLVRRRAVAPLMSGLVIDRFGAEWLWGLCAVVGTVAAVGYGVLMRRLPVATGALPPIPRPRSARLTHGPGGPIRSASRAASPPAACTRSGRAVAAAAPSAPPNPSPCG